MTDAHRQAIAAALRGRRKSPEHRAKLSAAMKGRKKSPEAVEAMRAARRGRTLSQEHRDRIAIAITRWHKEKRPCERQS